MNRQYSAPRIGENLGHRGGIGSLSSVFYDLLTHISMDGVVLLHFINSEANFR